MEATFQKVILSIAIVLLIILLIVINMTLSNSTATMPWPPINTNCPDYWVDVGTGAPGSGCFNSQSIGTCKLPAAGETSASPRAGSLMDFTGSAYKGADALCVKKRWANSCGVTWDGITYGYGAKDPCAIKRPA